MKFLLDQDVYVITVRFLAALGHDVIRAAEVGLSTASDEDILREAQSRGRLLVTRDRDFGNLVFVRGLGPGVLFFASFRPRRTQFTASWNESCQVYSEEELRKAFVVVEPGGHRFRRLSVST